MLCHRARHNNAPVVRFCDGNADGDVADAGETLYYTWDANHNITALVSATGSASAVVERYVYSPYGGVTVLAADFTPTGTSPAHDGPLYCGYWLDAETGNYLARNRIYNTVLYVWAQRDPLGYAAGDANLTRYCGGSPVNAVDPTGQWARYDKDAQEKYVFQAGTNDTFRSLVEKLKQENPQLAHLSTNKNQFLIRPWEPKNEKALKPDGWNGTWTELKRNMRDAWTKGESNGRDAEPANCGLYDASRLFDLEKNGATIIVSIGTDNNNYIRNASEFFEAQLRQQGRKLVASHAGDAETKRRSGELSPVSALATFIGQQAGWGMTPIQTLIIIGHSWRGKDWIGGNQTPTVPGAKDKFTIGSLVNNGALIPEKQGGEGLAREEVRRALELWRGSSSSSGIAASDKAHTETRTNPLAFWTTYEHALQGKLSPVAWLAANANVWFVGCITDDFAATTARFWLRGSDAKAHGTLSPTYAWSGQEMGWSVLVDGRSIPLDQPRFRNWQQYLTPPNDSITLPNGTQLKVWQAYPGLD